MRKLFSFLAAVLVAVAANAAVINIDTSTPNALQAALNSAATGDEIVMAAGTYQEEGNYLAFTGKELTVRAAEGAEVVIKTVCPVRLKEGAKAEFINIKFDCSTIGSYEQVIVAADDTDNKRVILTGCEFYGWEKNKAMIQATSSRRLAAVTINNCYFHNCMKSVVFIENTNAIDLSITNSTFANISTDASSFWAGVIDSRATTGSILVDHCTFYNVQPMNTDYGAIGKVATPGAVVSNCIFELPTSQDGVRAIRDVANATNCITFNYLKDSGTGIHSSVTQTNCVQVDPKFVDAANGNYTLGEGSPALTMNDGQPIGDPRWVPAAALAAPDAAPTAPTWPANQVKAVYSATYDADCGFGEWGSGTAYAQEDYGKKYVTTSSGYFGLLFEGDNALNCTNMEKLHLDVWVAADASIRVVPIWKAGGTEKGVTCALKGQQWNAIDIALSEYDNVTDWSNIYQIKIDEARELTFWVNNVYFYTTVVPAVDETAPAEFTASLDAASFFSAKIKAQATDASGAVSYTVKNGDAVVASAIAASGAEAVITVKDLTPNTDYNFSVIASDESGNAAEPIAVAVKTAAAPAADAAPETGAAYVKSIYSDTYTAAPASFGTLNAGWWEPSELFEGQLADGDNVLFYATKATGMFGWEFAQTDVTGYPYLHISIYPLADGKIKIYPVVDGANTADYEKTVNVKGGEWNHLVLDYTGKDLSKLMQIGWIDYYALNGFFVDNVYFSKSELPAYPQLNIFASGLKASAVADGKVTIDYVLNAYATAVEIHLLNAEGELVKAFDGTLNKGANKVELDLDGIAAGSYKWAIKAEGEPNVAEAPVKLGTFGTGHAMGRAVALDKNPESPYYGNVYTVNGQGVGLLGFDVTLNPLFGGEAVAKNGWGSGNSAPCRAAVGEDGLVYICDWSDSNPNVRIFNPAEPTKDAVDVFGGTAKGTDGIMVNEAGDTIHGSMSYAMPFGTGENTYLVTVDEDYKMAGKMVMYKYAIGTAATPYTAKPEIALAVGEVSGGAIANANVTFAPSKGGGWWVSQHRYADASANPVLAHISANNTVDYKSNAMFANATVGYNNQASFDINSDESMIVTSTSNTNFNIIVSDVTWTDGVPTVTPKYTIPTGFGNTCLKVAIDEAGNIYGIAAGKPLTVWATPKADNSCVTPAPKASVIEIAEEPVVDDTYFEYIVTETIAKNTETPATGGTIIFGADKFETMSGTDLFGYKLDGNPSETNTKYVLCKLNRPLAENDVISITGFASSNPKDGQAFQVSLDRAGAKVVGTAATTVAKAIETLDIPVKADAAGATEFYITRVSASVYFTAVKVHADDGTAIGISSIDAADAARKVMIDGQLFIIKGDAMYTITGARVK